MCVYFLNFVHFLYPENSSSYFKVTCRSLKKILIIRDVLECLYYNINWKSQSAFAQMRASESVFGFLKEERKCSDSSVVLDE